MASHVDGRKPLVAIFLDPEVFVDSQDSEAKERCSQDIDAIPKRTEWDTRQKLIKRIETRHYSPDAMTRFMQLIERVQKSSKKIPEGAEVMIVLSTGWTSRNQSIESMKEENFCDTPFVNYIRDRTPEHSEDELFVRDLARQSGRPLPPLGGGKKIVTWLRNNATENRFPIDYFVMIDSVESLAASMFPKYHVCVNPEQLFSAQNLEDAYRIVTDIPGAEDLKLWLFQTWGYPIDCAVM